MHTRRRPAKLETKRRNPDGWLRKSAQDERVRAARLEQDLATAHRDFETQAALAARASEEAARARQTAERGTSSSRRARSHSPLPR
jgi:hypothetical protein